MTTQKPTSQKQQTEFFDEHIEEVYREVSEMLLDEVKDIMALARVRWMQGYLEFGSAIFDKTHDELTMEVKEELADACNWKLGQKYERLPFDWF